MKPSRNPFARPVPARLTLTGSLPALVLFAGFVQINTVQAQWVAAPANNAFGNVANWTGGVAASVNGNFTQGSTITTLSVANDQQIPTGGNIIFSGATTPTYTLGLAANTGYFDMFSGSSIQMLAGVTSPQVINAGFNQAGTTANKASIITASAVGQTLTINGNYNTQNLSGTNFAGLSNYFNIGGTGGTAILNGIISDGRTAGGAAVLGNIIVKKQGTASYTLNGVNTYTGGTEMGSGSTGTVTLGNNLALGTGAIRVISGTGGTGSGFVAGTPLTGANAIANTFNYVGNTGASTSNTYSGPTTGSDQVTITIASGTTPVVGDLVTGNLLGYFPNYTRVAAVSGSGVGAVITLSNVAGNTTATAQTASTAAFNNTGAGTSTISGTNAIEFSGTQNLTTTDSNLAAGTQTFNIENTADTTFSGVLQQQGGTASVTKTGAGKLILTNANTYAGNTTITTGTLQLGDGGTTGSLAITGNFTNNANLIINRSNTIVQGVDFNTAAITGTGTLTHAGAGTVILTAANTFSGATTISGGTLQLGNGGATGSLNNASAITNNGILAINRTGFYTQSNLIGGSGSVLMTSTLGTAIGSVTLNNAASNYTGTTTIQNGDINVGPNSILTSTNGPLGNAATAIILGTVGTQTSSAGGGFGPNAAVIVTSAGAAASYSITRDFDSSATANVTGRSNVRFNGPALSTGTLTISSNWTLGTGASRGYGLVANQPGQTVDFTGAISGSGSTGTFRINDYGGGTGFVRLSNSSNSYAGPTTVTNGTLLIAGDAGASSGVLGTSSVLNVAEGGNGSNDNAALTDGAFTVGKTITLQNSTITPSTWTLGGNQAAVSSFSGNVNTAANANSRTLRLTQVAGGTVTFSGVIGANTNGTGTTSIDKIGLGTVNLTNTNTYDGDTTVTDGTLSMSAPAMPDTSTLTIGTVAASPAILNLPNAGTDIVAALYIDGVLQPTNALYGSTNSGGAITGPGKIQVGTVVANDYDTWKNSFTYAGGADTTPTGDADGDGLTNQHEYAFGLLPNSGSSVNAIVVPLSKSTGKFSYTRRTLGLPSPAITYTIQTSTDLDVWTPDASANQTVVGTVGEVQTVEVTLSAAIPLTDPALTAPVLFIKVVAQ